MTVIVPDNLKYLYITRNDANSKEEKVFHIQQDADLILIGIEEIKQEEEDEN